MDEMDLGVSFGSSAGIEAAHMKKPVVLLAGCYYYHLDATYNPTDRESDISLLLNNKIQAKTTNGSTLFGFYMSYPEGYTKPFKYEVKRQEFLGIKFWETPHMRFLFSKTLYKIMSTLLSRVTFLFKQNQRIPTKELNPYQTI